MIELVENEWSESITFGPAELAELDVLLGTSVSFRPDRDHPGRFRIRVDGKVGAGEIAGVPFSVAPKFPVRRILFMLAYVLGDSGWKDGDAHLGEESDFVTSIAAAYCHVLGRALSHGLRREYIDTREALPGVRGQIDMAELVGRRLLLIPPIDCRFDEFTEDNAMNRLLLAATERLRRLPRVQSKSEVVHALDALRRHFGHVSRVRFAPGRLPDIRFDRLNQSFRSSVGLARLILEGGSLESGATDRSARAFFIDTARLFEDFLVVSLRESLGVGRREMPSGSAAKLWLDVEKRVPLKPDLSLWKDGRCVFVGDAKYKWVDLRAGVGDLYQLASYMEATGLSRSLLVFARAEVPPRDIQLAGSGRIIQSTSIDLDTDPAELLDQVERLASRIRRIAAARVLVA